MARWFRTVWTLLFVANVVGAAALIFWWLAPPITSAMLPMLPRFEPALGHFLPLALSLVVVLIAWLSARQGRTPGPNRGLRHVVLALIANASLALASVLTLSGFAAGPWWKGAPAETARSGSVVILAVNDVYRIEGVAQQTAGNLARLRTLRATLERAHPGRVLLLHGGDVIFPSLLSRRYSGEQMIDVLNLMDGDAEPTRIDERMFVVFGNHEFDAESCDADSVLQQRVAQSAFYWLHSNITFTPCSAGRPPFERPNLVTSKIVEIGGLRIGLFGLTIDPKKKKLSFRFGDPREVARTVSADLRRRGADVVVAVTHLNWSDDVQLHAEIRDIDLIIGGHDHNRMRLPEGVSEPRIFKADADAVTAWVVTVTRGSHGRVTVSGELRSLDEQPGRPTAEIVKKDEGVQLKIEDWLKKHDAKFCEVARTDPAEVDWDPTSRPAQGSTDCLNTPLADTQTELHGSEETIRTRETSLGNWVADQMLAAFKDCNADAAFINAGTLRLNQDLPPGPITIRDLQELIGFKTELQLYKLKHSQLWAALRNAISQPNSGRWLQVSKQLKFTYQPATDGRGGPGRLLKVLAGNPLADVTESGGGEIKVVATRFLKDYPDDGYDKILPDPDPTCKAAGTNLKLLLHRELKKQGELQKQSDPEKAKQGRISPRMEGRITVQDPPRR